MGEIILKAEKLKKIYEDRTGGIFNKKKKNEVLDGVSFEICRGKTLGLAGESGCGKSTAGKMILNLIRPDGGRLSFEDTVIYDVEKHYYISSAEMKDLRKKMQMIFQDPASSLNPKKNVEQIISAGLKVRGIKSRGELRDGCADIMEQCGLDRRLMMRYPHEFSGGQKQRIGIARTLAVNPEFIVCDEPTAALDMSVQSQILNLMLDLKEKYGLTYLFISHNLGVMEHFCDELIVMYKGRIVERGETAEIFGMPVHPYTKLLLSSVPVSFPGEEKHREPVREDSREAPREGCLFAPRCPYCREECFHERPELKNIGDNHMAACHLI